MPKINKNRRNIFDLIILMSTLLLFATTLFATALSRNSVSTGTEKAEGFITLQKNELSGRIDYSEVSGFYEGKKVKIPELTLAIDERKVLGAGSNDRYIEVDLSEQKLRAWDGGQLFLETLVSTGLPRTPTPTGEFRIWIKLRATRMEGGSGSYYYNLPNVPYTMFFYNSAVPKYKGYGLHGTYWHNDFGRQKSHGCVNLPTPIAKELYYWTSPQIPDGKNSVFASDADPGTRIVIHE